MAKIIGITWNHSGVYLYGFTLQEVKEMYLPIFRLNFPKIQIQEIGTWPIVIRIHKLAGQDELVGTSIEAGFLASGRKPCDPPTNSARLVMGPLGLNDQP